MIPLRLRHNQFDAELIRDSGTGIYNKKYLTEDEIRKIDLKLLAANRFALVVEEQFFPRKKNEKIKYSFSVCNSREELKKLAASQSIENLTSPNLRHLAFISSRFTHLCDVMALRNQSALDDLQSRSGQENSGLSRSPSQEPENTNE